MTEAAEFVARENIRRFKAQLVVAPEGSPKEHGELLASEERVLRSLVAMTR